MSVSAVVLDWVDRGPVDLADTDGDPLLMLAANHGHASLVAGLATGVRSRRRSCA